MSETDTTEARKARGTFFTPPAIADFRAAWAVSDDPDARVDQQSLCRILRRFNPALKQSSSASCLVTGSLNPYLALNSPVTSSERKSQNGDSHRFLNRVSQVRFLPAAPEQRASARSPARAAARARDRLRLDLSSPARHPYNRPRGQLGRQGEGPTSSD